MLINVGKWWINPALVSAIMETDASGNRKRFKVFLSGDKEPAELSCEEGEALITAIANREDSSHAT